MRRCGRSFSSSAVVLGLLSALVVPARAQQAAEATPAPAAGESMQYRTVIESALEEFRRGHWTEAYALFMQAHALEPSARTLRGLAACAFEARQYLRAIEYMQAALSYATKPLSDDQRREGSELIDRAQVFVARVTLAVEPAEARVEVDAVPATRDDQGRVLLDPGPHQIAFSRAGHVTETRSVNVNPGDSLHIALRLAPIAPPSTPTVGVQGVEGRDEPAKVAPTAAKPASSVGNRTWAWVAAGSSVAFAGAGAAFFLLGRDGVGDIESACPKDACSNDELERKIDDRHLEELQVGTILAFTLSGASAIVSALLFADSSESADATTSATMRGAVLRGQF